MCQSRAAPFPSPYRKWKAEVERFRFLFFPPFPPSDGGFFFLDCLDFLHSTAAPTPSCFSTSRDLLHFFPYSDIREAMSLLPSDWSKRAPRVEIASDYLRKIFSSDLFDF